MRTLQKIISVLALIISLAATYFYYASFSEAGPRACMRSSSISCDASVYVRPLIIWAAVLAICLIITIALFTPAAWHRKK
jgi:hypothetical protein